MRLWMAMQRSKWIVVSSCFGWILNVHCHMIWPAVDQSLLDAVKNFCLHLSFNPSHSFDHNFCESIRHSDMSTGVCWISFLSCGMIQMLWNVGGCFKCWNLLQLQPTYLDINCAFLPRVAVGLSNAVKTPHILLRCGFSSSLGASFKCCGPTLSSPPCPLSPRWGCWWWWWRHIFVEGIQGPRSGWSIIQLN